MSQGGCYAKIDYMRFDIKIGNLQDSQSEAVVVFAWEEKWLSQAEEIDKKTDGLLKKEAEKKNFRAEQGKFLFLSSGEKLPAEKVILAGLGKKSETDEFSLRQVFAALARRLKEESVVSISLSSDNEFEFISAAVEGILLGGYKFKKYKTSFSSNETENKKDEDKEKELEVTILVKNARELVSVREAVTRGEIYSEATIFARDLVNEPSSVTTPGYLAEVANKLAKKEGYLIKIYDESEFGKLGMGALAGIARGSEESAKFIKLEYRHGKKKVIIVGKGITFDSGGLSLKPQDSMETMKMDMAGAAAILAIFSVIAKLRPKVDLIGLIPATENMPSGKAIKPGDIVKAYNGKTIEVLNTDAEGRVILADALAFGATLKPDAMIDLATLTGACMVALGEEIAGVFSKEEKLKEQITKAADTVGEKIWPMPLEKAYKPLLKSEVADIKNVSGKRYGGAITAALFLEEFVGNIPWAHLDIAGPAWEEKGTAFAPKGGTGFGVRTVLNFLQNQ